MNYYIYDGSFEGLLSAFYDIFYLKDFNCNIISKNKSKNIIFNKKELYFDEEKYERTAKTIIEKISYNSFINLYKAYLSEVDNIENNMLIYVKKGINKGKNFENDISCDEVCKIEKIAQKVSKEAHRIKGLLRFREIVSGEYYAIINPDHNIIYLIVNHFKKRFSNQNWVIHDVKRKIAAIYNCKEINFVNILEENDKLMDMKNTEYLSENEKKYQQLWKDYFKSISIEDRKNEKLQMSFMPKKYWKYLIEKF